MNELIVIALMVLSLVTLVVITVKWWFREYKTDEYIEDSDYLFDDFYTLSKDARDENSW